jgi:hypothetical protein
MNSVWGVENPHPIAALLIDRGLLEPVGRGRYQIHPLMVLHAKSLLGEQREEQASSTQDRSHLQTVLGSVLFSADGSLPAGADETVRVGALRNETVSSPDVPELPQHAVTNQWDDDVQFTVFRPKRVRFQEWKTLLVFAHHGERSHEAPLNELDPVKEVNRRAESLLGVEKELYDDLRQESTIPIPREGELTLVPEMQNVEFNPRRSSFLWTESVHQVAFRFRASEKLDGRSARGQVSVFLGAIVVAQIPLKVVVESGDARKEVTQPLESVTVSPYRRIFASYSHKDVAVVEEFERYAQALGDEYIRDVLHLRSGQVWSQRLLRMVDEASVFQLFWSSNSMRSEFVGREWRYALGLNRENFVRPVYWETPLPEAPELDLPPNELRALHFHRIAPRTHETAGKTWEPNRMLRARGAPELSPAALQSVLVDMFTELSPSLNEGSADLARTFEAPAVSLPPPTQLPPPSARSNARLILGVAAIAILVALIVMFFMRRSK